MVSINFIYCEDSVTSVEVDPWLGCHGCRKIAIDFAIRLIFCITSTLQSSIDKLKTRFCFSFLCLQGIADLNTFSKPAVLGALAHFILNAYVAMVGLPLALLVSVRTILLNDAFQCSLSALSLLIYSALPEIVLDRFLVFDSRNPFMSRMKTH